MNSGQSHIQEKVVRLKMIPNRAAPHSSLAQRVQPHSCLDHTLWTTQPAHWGPERNKLIVVVLVLWSKATWLQTKDVRAKQSWRGGHDRQKEFKTTFFTKRKIQTTKVCWISSEVSFTWIVWFCKDCATKMAEASPSSIWPNKTLFSDRSPTTLRGHAAAKHFRKLVLLAKHQLPTKLTWLCFLDKLKNEYRLIAAGWPTRRELMTLLVFTTRWQRVGVIFSFALSFVFIRRAWCKSSTASVSGGFWMVHMRMSRAGSKSISSSRDWRQSAISKYRSTILVGASMQIRRSSASLPSSIPESSAKPEISNPVSCVSQLYHIAMRGGPMLW